MKALRITVLVLGVLAAVVYTVGLGIYAVTSTRSRVPSQPRDAQEAREVVRSLGLESEYDFEHGFVATPHGRMHYVSAGEGAPVLCLHGNPTWSFLYRSFLRGLADDARVVAPDLIGFGLSEKPREVAAYSIQGHVRDVEALIEALDLDEITLVMQDWGGPIGLNVATRHPDRIRGLIVMNTLGFLPQRSDGSLPLPLRALRIPGVGEQLVQGLGLVHRVLVPAALVDPDPRVVRAYREVQGNWYERSGALAFPRLIPDGPDHPTSAMLEESERYLASYRGPLLLVWGMRDPVFPPSLLEEWKERFPEAQVLELPEAGHFLQEDAPGRIIPRVREFLRGS